MWTRKELKDRAKQVLKTSYWKAFLVSLLFAFIGGGVPSCSFNSSFSGGSGTANSAMSALGVGDGLGSRTLLVIIILAIMAAAVVIMAFLAFHIFLKSPLEVGIKRYFKQAALDDVNMNHLGYAFNRGNYAAIVKGMLWSDFLNFLWFLLLIIPGFIKMYAYSMVPYILGDNSRIGAKRAVELSNRMTRGQKWHMLVLDLSFIGWFILGSLALGVGVLFVLPYYNSTRGELYLVLRQRALDQGICSRTELDSSN